MLDYDAAKENRANRAHPADFQPGQEPSFNQGSDFFGSGQGNTAGDTPFSGGSFTGGDTGFGANPAGGFGGFGDQSFGANSMGSPMSGVGGFGDQNFGTVGSTPFGGGGFAGSPLPGQGMQQQPQQKSDEDKFYDGVKAVGKGGKTFVTDVLDSFNTVTPRFWSNYGFKSCIAGIITLVLGLVVLFVATSGTGAQMIIAGLVSTSLGVIVWLFNVEKAKEFQSEYRDIQEPTLDDTNFKPEPEPAPEPAFDMSSQQEDMPVFDDDSDDPYGDPDDDDEDYYAEADSVQPTEGVSADVALETMPEVPKGMYTREFLYEMFTKTLPQLKPDFAKVTDYDEDDNLFLLWDSWIQEAGKVCGCKEEALPMLISLRTTMFAYIVVCDRPSGFKPEAVAEELCNIYADRAVEEGIEEKHPDRTAVSAMVENVGMQCRITIKNGKSALIGLRDMLETDEVKKFFLSTKNYMPVVLGVDQLGHVIYADFKKVESVLITGMPRSGKSWFVQAVLTQMCGFLSPDDLNLYICDPKGDISDFKSFILPHVKKFATTDASILATLRYLINTEAPRRKKIIGDAGNVNIWDYKDRYPDVKMPLIYVVIDEVVTLAERMDKETKADFQGMLTVLVSQLPALGIRIFMIPHVIKNDIISKTTTDLIQCRISVMGTPDHIESSTGTKPRDFKIKLANVGDMAVRMPIIAASTFFSHGPALTDSNQKNNNFFDYLRRVWNKLNGITEEPTEPTTTVDAQGNIQTDESSKHLKINATPSFDTNKEDGYYDPLSDDASDPFS